MARFRLEITSVVGLFFLLAGCRDEERFYPVPTQFESDSGRSLQEIRFDGVRRGYPGAVISGVLPSDGLWRWTRGMSRFRFWPPAPGKACVHVQFSVAGATLSDTGPITLNMEAGGRRVWSEKFNTAGSYERDFTVEEQNVGRSETFDLDLLVEPAWIAPQDKVDLGIILSKVEVRFVAASARE